MKWSDRKVLIVATAVMTLLAAGMAIFAPPEEVARGGLPSVYATGRDGARAAYLLLRQLHYPVKIWTQPPADLPDGSTKSVLILADPTREPTQEDLAHLEDFVNAGGRILFTGRLIAQFFKGARVNAAVFESATANYDRTVPSNFTYGAPTVSLSPEAEWTLLKSDQFPLYGKVPKIAVLRWHRGLGEILWWAGPPPLTNIGISEQNNLNLFLDAMSEPGTNRDSSIYWDEYFHGEGDSLWSYFAKTPLPWGLWQFVFFVMAIFLTFGRRSGPIVSPVPVSRRSPLEYVDTLGGLYERAHAEPAVVQIVYDRFRLALKRMLRLP